MFAPNQEDTMKIRAPIVAALSVLVLALPASASIGTFYSFAGPDGETPAAPLVQGFDGFLYGVAAHGGDFNVLPPDGGGTIFRTDAVGNLTTLHVFRGLEGAVPTGITQGRDGAFYGTTTYGGQPGSSPLTPGTGTIFRIDPAGSLTTLFVFPGGERGFRPGPLMQGGDGALYGTAVGGETLYQRLPGIVYRFDPATRDYRILHTFALRDGIYPDGKSPTGKLFQAGDGFFYGTTSQGGPWNAGVVYKVAPTGAFAVVHAFDVNEGSSPKAGVFQASDGFFYGTLEYATYGGKIFRLDAAGSLTTLFSFGPYAADGWRPVTNPIEGRDGFFYGTTPRGGSSSGSYGVVYRLSRSGSLSVLHSFSGPDGIAPSAALVQANDGLLYGSTVVGGAHGLGTLFKLDAAQPAPLPTLISLWIDPPGVVGGTSVTATVTLSWAAPPGGATISLTSNSSLASVPVNVTVPPGAKTASFPVSTKPTKKSRVATLTATYNGSQASGTLTITR
jgi:uncharacterized repeat protein (TIGR03803 family)